ncbi:Ohr family peroxiredoxin [Corynebacterium sp. zg254]|uniref:Organic hydroperoxide resistance protein n=1 Tax=Corynebacterium zhongnanshanii TaxID=2768834 RepID=A0ABQ6VEC8_9CORY|nr:MULTISPECIES: organic hydroperoxide resistance protein [Corynebacterium]KAB3522620.1 organic hydroperoxide resistance protein [Corynebacterium zhongnanshanii]MCR5914337.1 Ohr family peroxiredoxin [Corynebacterium sp. zg254]
MSDAKDALYTAKALSTGGGRDGHVSTDDRQIDLDTRPPKALGGSGEGTNPEQLVSAGWAACFNGALQLIIKNAGVKLDNTPEVTVETSLHKAGQGFELSAKISATVFDVDQQQAEELVAKAHEFCPYSKAMKGDITVEVEAFAG